MGDTAAAFRLGFAPVLLLGWNMAAGDPLPFLAANLLVLLLAGSAVRPPLKKLAGGLVVVVLVTSVFSRLFVALGEHPAAVWIVLFALAAACFARLAQRPGDLVAMLTLISASVVVVLRQWAAGLGLALPWLMGVAMVQAVVVTLIAHALLPSSAPAYPPGRAAASGGAAPAAVVFGKSAGLLAALAFAMQVAGSAAVLVALTAVTILAAPAGTAARGQGRVLLLANGVAVALMLPLLAVAAARPDPLMLLLLALAAALWLAAGIGRGGTRGVLARAGLPVFVVLLGVILPKADEALPLLIERLLTVGVVMLYCLAVMALLRPHGDLRRPIAEMPG